MANASQAETARKLDTQQTIIKGKINMLTFEDAYYFKTLLSNGFTEEYDKWFDEQLEKEEPLSDIMLDLSLCRSDLNETISCLHRYCVEQNFDSKNICNLLRLYLKDAYKSERFSQDEIVHLMHSFALSSEGDLGDFSMDIWNSMYDMSYYLSLAEDGIIPRENFDAVFNAYLNDGTPINDSIIWKGTKFKKESIIDRIKKIFKGNKKNQ